MTALADPTTVGPATRLRWAVGDSLALTKRNLTHIRHVPEKLIDVTLQPLIFVLLFAYVFGGAIDVPDGSYREYLMGGIIVQTLAFAIMGTAVGLADDMGKGVVDRFRSLPMARSAVLAGRALADMLANLIALAVLVVAGLIVGWGIHDGVASAIAGFALVLLFAYDVGGDPARPGRAHARRGPGLRVRGRVPADVPRQHVRGDERSARRHPPSGRVEPDQRGRRRGARPVRQPDRSVRRCGLAAPARDPGLDRVVRGDPRRVRPARGAALPARDGALRGRSPVKPGPRRSR